MKPLKLEFLENVDKPGYFCYKVKIINEGKETIDFDVSEIKSPFGKIIINDKFKVNNETLLNKGTLAKNEEIEGLICLKPSALISTCTPVIFFSFKKYKVKLKKPKKKVN